MSGTFDCLKQELAIIEARKHLEQGDRLAKNGDIASAVDEFAKGIDILLPGGTNEVLDLMAELRDARCCANNGVVLDRLNDGRESRAKIEQRCRDMIADATAELDLPKHCKSIASARCSRVMAVSYLVASLKVDVSDADLQMAHRDIQAVLADPSTTDTQKGMVTKALTYIPQPKASGKVDVSDIKPSFLTADDLRQVDGLNVFQPGKPRMRIARSFMNKSGPVQMSDGSPKEIPPQVGPLSALLNMSAAQLNRKFGMGAGTFFGEIVFWKKYGGVILGKQKWESGEGMMMNDTAKCSEVWDMRWVFKTSEGARGFFQDMVDASRAEDGNGIFDSNSEFTMKPAERASLSSNIDTDCVAVTISYPRKRPKNLNNPTSSMAAAEMFADPPAFLQQYGAVFVVDRVVVKLYTIEGFNNQQGPLKRSVLFGKDGLINRAALTIQEWLDGTRTEYRQGADGAFAEKSACANCGNKSDDLKQCTRCKSVAYCNRECQLAHYKVHRKPCRKLAASK